MVSDSIEYLLSNPVRTHLKLFPRMLYTPRDRITSKNSHHVQRKRRQGKISEESREEESQGEARR